MSADNGDRPEYEVGYGKPPRAHQFKPGVSGNPKGRPRKVREPSWEELAVDDLLISTFARELTGFENGRKSTVTSLDAVVRRMVASALKGNVQAQRAVLKLASDRAKKFEDDRNRTLFSAFEAQIELDRRLSKWLANGNEENSIAVHPRDIEIDWVAREVRLFVALTREQLEARSLIITLRDEAIAAIQVSLATAAEDGDDGILEFVRNVAASEIDYLNQFLPSRFRRSRPNESRHEAAKAALGLPAALREQARNWHRRVGPILKQFLLVGVMGRRVGNS